MLVRVQTNALRGKISGHAEQWQRVSWISAVPLPVVIKELEIT
jgi:hypothetical protein